MSRANLTRMQPELVSLCVEKCFYKLLFSNAKYEIIKKPFEFIIQLNLTHTLQALTFHLSSRIYEGHRPRMNRHQNIL